MALNSGFAGVLYAFAAVAGWGIGGYFIQKVSRMLGIWKTMFFMSLIGTLGLLPWAWRSIHLLSNPKAMLWTGLTGLASLLGSIFVFESFKEGKLAVMEPIISAELPVAVILSVTLWHESLSAAGWILVITIFLGIVLAVTEHPSRLHYHRRILEKGALFATVGALLGGLTALLTGASSQEVSPLLTVWVMSLVGLFITTAYLAYNGRLKGLLSDFRLHAGTLIVLGVLDTGAWIGFGSAAARIPISIATTISEGYIPVTVLMGIFVNRERLRVHQAVGALTAVVAVIILAAITG